MIAESPSSQVSKAEKLELLALLEEKARRDAQRRHLLQFETLYEWQRKFVKATADNTSCMLMAANRVGKTRTGLTIDAMHLLGDYPDDWEGHKFDHAPMCWLLGFSMEKTRDLLQTPLFWKSLWNTTYFVLLGVPMLKARLELLQVAGPGFDLDYDQNRAMLSTLNVGPTLTAKFQTYRYLRTPEEPVKRDSPRRVLLMIMWGIVGGLIGAGVALTRRKNKRNTL